MKPARFILNSDYTTVRNTGHIKIPINIPDDFYAPESESGEYYTIGVSSAALPSSTDSFSIFLESSKYNYITLGSFGYNLPVGATTTSVGSENIYMEVTVSGSQATFRVFCLNTLAGQAARFTGYGQTVTAHILTFKDPFSE